MSHGAPEPQSLRRWLRHWCCWVCRAGGATVSSSAEGAPCLQAAVVTKCGKRCEFQSSAQPVLCGRREVVVGSSPMETVSDVGIGRRVHKTLSRSCVPVPGHKRWDIHGHPQVRRLCWLRNIYHELKDGGCWRSFAFCERLLDGRETCLARPGRKGWRLAGVPGQGCLGRGACTPRVGFSGSQRSWDAGQEPHHPSARGSRGTVASLGAGTGLSRCVGSGQAQRPPL